MHNLLHFTLLLWSCLLAPALAVPSEYAVIGHEHLKRALPKGLQLRILPLGDSITYGMGGGNGNSYRKDLYEMLTQQGAQVTMIGSQRSGNFAQPNNEGWSGFTINQISGRADNSIAKNPNLVLLMAGTNDLGPFSRDPKEQAPDRLGKLIDKLTTALPNAVVIASSIPPMGFGMGGGLSSLFGGSSGGGLFGGLFGGGSSSSGSSSANFGYQQYNAAIPGVVQARAARGKKVAFADMSAIQSTDLYDGVHPNVDGYKKAANAWMKAIEEVAAKGWISPPK